MGEGPGFSTPRLSVVPVTLWNAGLAAHELAPLLPPVSGEGWLRNVLRRRATSHPHTLTWVAQPPDGLVVGLVGADLSNRRALVSVAVGAPYRRHGYASEVLRAVASWLEVRHAVVVEARAADQDTAAGRLYAATGFVPTEVVEQDRRIWFRPPIDA